MKVGVLNCILEALDTFQQDSQFATWYCPLSCPIISRLQSSFELKIDFAGGFGVFCPAYPE